MPSASAREFVSGETVLYLGRNYRLRVEEGRELAAARLDHGRLIVSVKRGLARAEQSHAVRAQMVACFRLRAAVQLRDRVTTWSEKVRVQPRDVLIRDPKRRWGSCDPSGALRFNWRIIQVSPSLVDYVVCHELVHLHHRHHTAAFWAELGRVMPDYEDRRARLTAKGPFLVW